MNEIEEDTEFEKLFRAKREGPKASFNLSRFLRQMENYTPIDQLLVIEARKQRQPKKKVRFDDIVHICLYDPEMSASQTASTVINE
jgi:hypothetical protein